MMIGIIIGLIAVSIIFYVYAFEKDDEVIFYIATILLLLSVVITVISDLIGAI